MSGRVTKKDRQLALGAAEPPISPEPEHSAPVVAVVGRYRVRAVEAVILGPDGRVVGFGRKADLMVAARKMGEVVDE